MLSGVTLSASDMAGTAVFKIVVSSDSMKNATATSHGKSRLLEADGDGADGTEAELVGLTGLVAMESSYHSTSEPENLPACAAARRKLHPCPGVAFARHLVPPALNHLYKTPFPLHFPMPLSCYDLKTLGHNSFLEFGAPA